MGWVKVDDGFSEHPKAIDLSLAAKGLWVEGLCYCSRRLTDGLVPAGVVRRAGGEEQAAELVAAGLWEACEGGWRMHDYLDHQRSKSQVESTAKARAEAGAKGAASRWDKTAADGTAMANGWQTDGKLLANGWQPDGQPMPDTDTERDTETETDTNGSLRSLPARGRARVSDDPPGFALFWDAYPRKADRKNAVAEWRRLAPDDALIGDVLAGVQRAKADDGFAAGTYAPYAVRWLKGRRWEDAPPPTPLVRSNGQSAHLHRLRELIAEGGES